MKTLHCSFIELREISCFQMKSESWSSIHLLRKSLEFDLSFVQTTKEIVFFSKVLDTFVKINKFDNVWLPIFVMLNTSQRITMFFRFQKSDQKGSRYYRFWQ